MWSWFKLDRENEHLIALSKREKDLAQAQLATEWRKQQACSLKQTTGHQVCKLTTAQEQQPKRYSDLCEYYL